MRSPAQESSRSQAFLERPRSIHRFSHYSAAAMTLVLLAAAMACGPRSEAQETRLKDKKAAALEQFCPQTSPPDTGRDRDKDQTP